MNDNYLIHFGNKNSGRYPRGSGERPHQHDGLSPRQERRINRKKRKNIAKYSYRLSDQDLNRRIDRLSRENRLKDETHRANTGRAHTNKILKNSGDKAAGAFVGAVAGAAGAFAVKKIIERFA